MIPSRQRHKMTLINISESTRGNSDVSPTPAVSMSIWHCKAPSGLKTTPENGAQMGDPQQASRPTSLPHWPRAVGALVPLPNSHLTSQPHAEKEGEPHTMPWPSSIVHGLQESFSSRSASALGYKTRTLPAGSTAKCKHPKSHHCGSDSRAPNLCLSVINVW